MQSRRNFLRKIGLTAGALPFLPIMGSAKELHFTPSKTDASVLRVAIMGLGSYGTRVAEAIQSCKRARLTGLISGTPSKIKTWQRKYQIPEKNCYNYDTYDQIKNNPDIDAVYVITPNALHHEAVLRVAATGKQVICEKPMGLNAREGSAMVEACKNAGVRLLVGYRMHFEPNTLKVVQMRKTGALGEVQYFQGEAGFRIGDPTQWRLNKALSGGGSLMDIGIYAINGARYMTGEEPQWVTAQETKTDPVKFKEGIDETIQFQFGFPSGAVASCLSSYSMNHINRFFLNGKKGFAILQPASSYGPIKGETHEGPLPPIQVTQQTLQMDEMAAILLDGKQPVLPVDGEEAVKDLALIDAIYKACKTGQKIRLM